MAGIYLMILIREGMGNWGLGRRPLRILKSLRAYMIYVLEDDKASFFFFFFFEKVLFQAKSRK